MLAVTAMVSTETGMVLEHRASVLPAAQLLPVLVEDTAATRFLSPASGLFTVAEKVIVAAAPTARFPVQVRFGLVYETLPDDADASPLYVASSMTPDSEAVKVAGL